MNWRRAGRVAAQLVAAALLLLTVYNGFQEGPNLIGDAMNRRQTVVAVCQLLSATTAVLALLAWWRRARWTVPLLWAWTAVVTVLAAVASIAWTELSISIALVSGLGAAAVCGLVVWIVRSALRPRSGT